MLLNNLISFSIALVISQLEPVELHSTLAFDHLEFINSAHTLEPINIVSKDAKILKDGTLFFLGGFSEKWLLNNTGRSIEVHVDQAFTVGSATAGILYNDYYLLSHFTYYWHRNSTGSGHYAYSTVDGRGAQLEVMVYFYNVKYGSFRNALNFRNGLVALSCRVLVKGSTPNPLYFSFQHEFKKIKHPGKSLPFYSAISYVWYTQYPLDTVYYAYPGSYTDDLTGKTYYCTTTIVMDVVPQNFISHDQFEDTFGSLKDCSGRPMINAVKQHAYGLVPITLVKSRGFILKNLPK